MLRDDPIKRILCVDLSNKSFFVEERPELVEEWLGGVGLGTTLLFEKCPEGVDPKDPNNPIIFAVGPLNGVFPIASKTVALFVSPHNGLLGESHAGGRSGTAIRLAGYGAVVIKGRSDVPVYLVIDPSGVKFRDARGLWGLSATETGRFIREREKGSGLRSILRIGPAGEKGCTYSCVVVDTYRHFGRLGLGALFGYKNLKAVVITGARSLSVKSKSAYKSLYDELLRLLKETPSLKKYHNIGTAVNVLPLNELGALPTRNLKEARFEGAEGISGEYFTERLLGRRLACVHCPTACIHLAALRTPYKEDPYFYKTTFISYDYEPIYATGSMLGIGAAEKVLRLLDTIEELGLDAMSAGVVLAWATEAFEKGLVSERDTLGLKPSFGDAETYEKMLRLIAKQPNEFYESLARGVEYASDRYGGKEFALAFGGNEMPGYHTGYGAHLTHLTGSRHSHLDSGGYSYDQTTPLKELDPKRLAKTLFEEEVYRQVLASGVCCFFGRSVYNYERISKCLEVLDITYGPEELKEIGKRILKSKYEFKRKRGFRLTQLRIPKRILETVSPQGRLEESFLRKALAEYESLISQP